MKVAASPQIYMGRCPKAVFKSLVTGILRHRHPERSRGIFTALQEIDVYAQRKNDVLVLSLIRQ